jgi:hypothetical protein
MQQPSVGVMDARRPDAGPVFEGAFDGMSVGAMMGKYDADARLMTVSQRGSAMVYVI